MNDLLEIDTKKYNVLAPTPSLKKISQWQKASFTEVSVNLDPDAGDIFKVGSRMVGQGDKKEFVDLYSPAKPLLMRIANAAGVVWNWRDSGPIGQPTRDYIMYRAIGAVKLPDGTYQSIMATKELDLTIIEDELREQFTKKAGYPQDVNLQYKYKGEIRKRKDTKGKDVEKFYLSDVDKPRWVEDNVNTNMIQWRKSKTAKAETGAILRVIRLAFGMKGQYTRTELEKPFVVPRYDFCPDISDPDVRQLLIAQGNMSLNSLFGAVPESMIMRPHVLEVSGDDEEDSTHTVYPLPPDELPVETKESAGTDKAQAAPKSDNPVHKDVCSDCGKSITAKVAKYSSDKIGRALCMDCQKK
ncbi:hypothetical protein [Acetonema longum]|uniref:Uncharacterized protein n=1 Tax=Acetonema longum DSM 6540 TaxID=1009370 RepID=F7NKF1_9FIRM|nr:hypothetical protein [Acetonema longum]EGO63592.1 hypothetical protein ALO_12821 [Acetonema longum DSM 6540]